MKIEIKMKKMDKEDVLLLPFGLEKLPIKPEGANSPTNGGKKTLPLFLHLISILL